MLLNIHFFVCFWLLIANADMIWEVAFDYYVKGFYYITVTFTTVGYGDFLPDTNSQILYVIMLQLVGLALFAYFRGTLADISTKKSVHSLIKQKKDGIDDFLDQLD